MESGKGGGNSYWPGFVDALTNVIIAMIFVVVVLAIALSFAAQLMGKRVADKMISEYKAAAAASAASAAAAGPQAGSASPDVPPVPESKLVGRTVINVKGNEAASAPKSPQVTPARNVLQLKYVPGAITLDEAALKALGEAIKALPESARDKPVVLVATGPSMVLSDNQRSAFMRLMDVRNALIAQGYPATSISTRIDANSDAATPMVSVAFTEVP
jgi:predicted component of type VI protein secretion system